MKKHNKYIEIALWLGIMLVLCLPFVQQHFSVFKLSTLAGAYTLSSKAKFSKESWMNGEYQQKTTLYLNDRVGFRSTMIRAKNQIDFSLYRKGNADGITIGKQDWFYEYDYIREYIGEDFVGEKIIDRKVRQLKFLQKYLKKTQNIDLVFVFEPGKASVYPEFIPDEYHLKKGAKTNYQTYLTKVQQYNVKYIDLDAYFKKLKKTASHPLYPQYGIHWTEYGASLAADSLLHYIESVRKIHLAKYNHDSLTLSYTPKGTDYDVGKTLNLLFDLPYRQLLAYPVYHFDQDTTADKPSVLVIADSYYWNIFNTRIPKHLFANQAFWYFNDLVYPDTYFKEKHTVELNIKEEVEKQDVIFLMVTRRFLYKLDWKFLDKIYYQYLDGLPYDKHLTAHLNDILGYEKWFVEVLEKAKKRNITVEKMLWLEAKYVYYNDNPKEFLHYYGMDYYKDKIEGDKIWKAQVIQKAKDQGISVDSMLWKEAQYIFKQESPEVYPQYKALEQAKNSILKDSLLVQQTKLLADKYMFSFQEALLLKAEEMLGPQKTPTSK